MCRRVFGFLGQEDSLRRNRRRGMVRVIRPFHVAGKPHFASANRSRRQWPVTSRGVRVIARTYLLSVLISEVERNEYVAPHRGHH